MRATRAWFPLLIVVSCVASVAASAATPATVRAGGPFSVVDDPDRTMFDVSDNGRYVLTGSDAGGARRVVDRVAGTSTDVNPLASFLTSGGGMVVYSTTAQLTGADTDSLPDVYIENLDGSDVELMSQGFPGWSFEDIGDVADRGEGAIVLGVNGALAQVAPFRVSPFGTTRLDADLPPSSFGVRVFSILKTSAMTLWQRGDVLYADGLPGGGRQVMNLLDGAYVPIGDAVLQPGAPAPIVAFTHAVTGTVHFSGGGQVGPPISDVPSYPLGDYPAISLSSAGDVAWEAPAPTSFGSVIYTHRQLAVRVHDSESTVIESQPGAALADGGVRNGVISADGSTLLFTSLATNLAGTTDEPSVFASPPTHGPPTPDLRPSTFTPRTPVRVLDTRAASQVGYTGAMPGPGTGITLPMRGANGVPANASAVAIQLTAAEGTGVGYLAAIRSGAVPGFSSNLNIDEPGEAIANFAIAPIGSNGAITVFTQAPTHVVVDLVGWFTPAPFTVASAGRYVSVGPNRVLDTRPESRVGWQGDKPASTSITTLHVTGSNGIPASGVTAVAVNVTLTETGAPGYVQVAPASSFVVGASSTANVSRAGQTVAAATIVPVDANGDISIYTQMSTHVIVDISGWFTDGTAPMSGTGMFVPLEVSVRTDTRDGVKPSPGARLTRSSPGSAAVGNVTVTETDGPGFVQLGPSATMVSGATSNINPTRTDETMANFFIAPVAGGFDVFTSNSTHIVTDVVGYMTT
ncbi:MAG: hypothetical protein AB7L17_23445 [Ilumatobacteraceae bacterium]